MNTQRALYSPTQTIWHTSRAPIPYPDAVARMEAHVAAMAQGRATERVWLLEHPALYTAGTSANETDLISPDRFPVFKTGRGGQYTYHGPGQRVGYFMLDLKTRGRDVRAYVRELEALVMDTLGTFGVESGRREGRVGVWVNTTDAQNNLKEAKIAALGVRIRKWVSFHGISINVNPDLDHFSGIVPCGISEHGVTSLHDLGINISMAELDAALKTSFIKRFGPVKTD
ncbi:MAG: lipoate-protein ligase B [Robiginitomaculum sp.]|nr:MAG: lipoate-protein ligase B [Robiginitomaculum sp.]